ncbi:hypothetical protein Pmani_034735 [Petrolisthes manimaculis]|uniref:Serine/threonine-protein kinase Chk2 n=1 Tax=Petrolisthes manimaculis TaxID=1843537 RepID=A0AAE1TP36_9EUCA|nr:hypothetical protein Pmani_034735 [Petrolisthes manimaculis]
MDNITTSQASTQGLRETQEIPNIEVPDDDLEGVWGRLFSVRENVSVCNLVKPTYTFGRGRADYRFSEENFDYKILPAISKLHFRISREWQDDLDPVVVIEDLSCNGTFINNINLGKGKKKLLINNDEVALASPNTKVFVFHNCFQNDSNDYPLEVTEKYTMTKKLGQGNFGEVRLAYRQGTLERCAVKILQKRGSKLKLNNVQQISNEIELLRSVDHPFIIRLMDVMDTPEKIYIVMEAAGGGELFDRLVDNGRLPEATAKFYFYQLALAIQYLHSKKITHRDIKPENILLATDEENTSIKLTDFGLSKLAADTSQMNTFCGTISYIAPELLDTETLSYTKKVDLWSLGVVLFVSLCCYAPFDAEDMKVRYLIRNAIYSFHGKVWKEVSDEAKDLISKLMVSEPTKRLDVEETLKHPWLQDEDLHKKVLDILDEDPLSPSKKRRLEENGVENRDLVNAKTPKIQVGITEKM